MMSQVIKSRANLYKEERQKEIQEIIRNQTVVDVDHLAELFAVSNVTIRRDLNTLEAKGVVERTHGGAISNFRPQKSVEPELLARVNVRRDEKIALARFTAKQIKQGETIYLSAGSSVFYLARELWSSLELTVVTNSLIIATELSKAPGVRVVMLGGVLRKDEMALSYIFTQDTIKNLHFSKAIIGCRGIHPLYGITNDDDPNYIGSDSGILNVTGKAIVIADHTKIGFKAKRTLAPIDYVDTLITTSLAPKAVLDAFIDKGINVVTVDYHDDL